MGTLDVKDRHTLFKEIEICGRKDVKSSKWAVGLLSLILLEPFVTIFAFLYDIMI